MIQEVLKLGLTENESKVYLSLIELGSTNAGEIIKKTKLHRNIVYENLDKLIEKGFVSFVTIKNIKHFEITSLKELKEFVARKKEEINNEEEIISRILPELEKIRSPIERKQDATIFKGKRSIKNILEEITQSKTEVLVFGTCWGMRESMSDYYEQWHLKLKKNRTKCRIVLPINKPGMYLYPFITRYLSEEQIIPSTIAVFDNKVLNVIWGEEPLGILIISNKVADSYRNYFELLWKIAKK